MSRPDHYEIPDWMTPYLEDLGGRDEVVRLMSGHHVNVLVNAPLALLQNSMASQVALLHRLNKRGLLKRTASES